MSLKLQEVDAVTVKTWIDQGRARLFDIREADEYARERVELATSIPGARLTGRTIDGRHPDNGVIAVFHCNSGQRTREAAEDILACGFDEVYALKGGMAAWKAAGLETRLNRTAPISLQRQVQISAGGMVVAGLLLAWLLSPWFALLSGFVGMGLIFAGVTNTCALARLLALLPYNRHSGKPAGTLRAETSGV